MQRDDDEDAVWRSIVDNYGDRPDLGSEAVAPEASPDAEPARQFPDELPDQFADQFPDEPADEPEWFSAPLVSPDEDRFVPPPPPPLPRPALDRRVAWLGVLGSPLALLACLILGIGLPDFIAFVLVAAFVGGFLYLVWRMPRGPRDPWDDGAQV